MKTPLVSVIMPVYNAAPFLREAIQSILNQSYSNFEFIIVNDGSIDNSENIILSFNDKRIRYIKLEKNSGIVVALNTGIEAAAGEYIARMDSDDISLPDRFEKQINFLINHPDIGVLGSNAKYFGEQNFVTNVPISNEDIKAFLLFRTPFIHPTVMCKSVLLKQHPYSAKFPHMEDYYQWFVLMKFTKFANLNDVLLEYREHQSSISKINSFKNSVYLIELYKEIITSFLPNVSIQELEAHQLVKISFSNMPSDETINSIGKWMNKLLSVIQQQKVFPIASAVKEINKEKERFFYRISNFSRKKAIFYQKTYGGGLKFRHLKYLLRKINSSKRD